MYDHIHNPSDEFTMVATLRIPGCKARTYAVPPDRKLPVVGRVQWHLWSFRFRKVLPRDRAWVNG